jgi:TolB-like protein/tetratricopeptide (TPR) repeat protein
MPTDAIEVAHVRKVLAERYRIERVIGEGGMATVYLAEDLKHHRQVAVKVMRPELAATLGADRFLREVEIAARLNHPHILSLYDSGQASLPRDPTAPNDPAAPTVLYYVMPYVEGESLAARVAREGPLQVPDALRIAHEVADALAYAHRRGVVHRDVKPANILLSEGHALVADFGIARAAGGDANVITQTGLAIGTPQYMSPEQATGDKGVDARTDVYALGAVLYEMLTGEPPFTGRTPQAVVARSLTERPRPVASSREGLPPGLDALVARTLAKAPADRPATAAALAAELQEIETGARSGSYAPLQAGIAAEPSESGGGKIWAVFGAVAMLALTVVAFLAGRWGLPAWVLGVSIVLLAGGAAMLALTARAERARTRGAVMTGMGRFLTWRNAGLGGIAAVVLWAGVASVASARLTSRGPSEPAAAAAATGTRVAVLPFQNQGDTTDNYIVDGITDEVRGKLARVRGLTVIGSGSAAQYRGTSLSAREVARQLGAEYVLLGRVRWAGAEGARRVQVVPELVSASTGATTWQQSFEAELTDVFEVQSQIAARVAGALGTQLGSQETREIARQSTTSPAAWDAFVKGRAITAVDPVARREAAIHFEQAVAIDASFAEAWGLLSFSLQRVFINGAREPTVAARSREAFERAIAADAENAIGHAAAAGYYTNIVPDLARADNHLATALRLAPTDPDVLSAAGRADLTAGRLDSGVERLQRARELDPRSVAIMNELQRGLLAAGRYQEAVEVGDAAIALSPSDPGVYEWLAMAHVARGDLAAAQGAARRALSNGISPPAIAAYFAGYFEMSWLLDPETLALVGRLTPAAFDNDRAWWGQALATTYWTSARRDLARAYADSALAPSLAQVRATPEDPSVVMLYALMLAYAGRTDEALAEARRGIALVPDQRGINRDYDRLQLIRVYLASGEYEAAIPEIERLLEQRGMVSRNWLQLDPLFEPLRGNPKFQRMAGS